MEFDEEQWDKLMSFNPENAKAQILENEKFFLKLLDRLPNEINYERKLLVKRL